VKGGKGGKGGKEIFFTIFVANVTNILIMKTHVIFVLFFLSCMNCGCSKGTDEFQVMIRKNVDWRDISSYFKPPPQYENVFGDYRSPLVFANGDSVRTPADWTKRRKEIYDNWMQMMGKWPPFLEDNRFEYLDAVQKDGYVEHKVRFDWATFNKTTGYLLKPDRKGMKPAVIVVFYEPETAAGLESARPELYLDYARQLAKRGFVTLSIGTSEVHTDNTFMQFYPDYQTHRIEILSLEAYLAANAWYALSKVDDVDEKRIGITGWSYGGKWAMFSACLFDRFACAVWNDAGIVFDESRPNLNYWEPYYLCYHDPPWRRRGPITPENPAKGLYLKLRAEGYDMHELHALMAPRPFLITGGFDDPVERWIPLNHSIAVNRLLGYSDRVAMSNRTNHEPNEESNEILADFFSYYLDF